MKIKHAYAQLMATVHANTAHGISQAITHVVHHALVHGQVRIKDLNAIRTLQDPKLKAIKVALGKTMPVTWDKEKETYKFSKVKRKSLQAKFTTDSIATLSTEIREVLTPPKKEQGEKQVKAWGEAQIQAQVKRLDEMDADQLQAQIYAMQSLLATANDKLRMKLSDNVLAFAANA